MDSAVEKDGTRLTISAHSRLSLLLSNNNMA